VTGRILYYEELHNLYSSLNIVRIKSKWMRCGGHVACMEKVEMRTKILLKGLKGKDHSEDLGVDGRLILK
jgi:hypothetical protein